MLTAPVLAAAFAYLQLGNEPLLDLPESGGEVWGAAGGNLFLELTRHSCIGSGTSEREGAGW